jgi:hypothetical protein
MNEYLSSVKTDRFLEWEKAWPNDKTNIGVSYIVSYGYHEIWAADYPTYISQAPENRFIRENTRDILQTYSNAPVDMKWKSQSDFHNHLKDTLVSITVPGWGEREGESFTLDNLEERLDYIFNNKEEIDKIRFNGKLKLHQGFDIGKSAEQLYNFIK